MLNARLLLEYGRVNSEQNLVRIMYFVIGFMAGVLSVRALVVVTPIIPVAQLIENQCPRVNGAGGSMWCTGPGVPR